MDSLEAELERIEELEADLSAETVLQEAREGYERGTGKYDFSNAPHGDASRQEYPSDYEITEWVPSQSRIAKPNTIKRESAKAQLQQILELSDWYSARFKAALALGLNSEDAVIAARLKEHLDRMASCEIDAKSEEDLRCLYNLPVARETRSRIGKLLGYGCVKVWRDRIIQPLQPLLV